MNQVYLGAFGTEQDAAHAYDKAAIAYWGCSAKLNVCMCVRCVPYFVCIEHPVHIHLCWWSGAVVGASAPATPPIDTRSCMYHMMLPVPRGGLCQRAAGAAQLQP